MTEPDAAPSPSAATTVSLLRSRLEQGPIELAVDGHSMGSTIMPGSTVTVVAAGVPRPGQIWAIVDPDGKMIVHRYRKRSAGAMVFRGDGNLGDDDPVHPEMLIGRVMAATTDGTTVRFGLVDRLTALARHLWYGLSRRVRRR